MPPLLPRRFRQNVLLGLVPAVVAAAFLLSATLSAAQKNALVRSRAEFRLPPVPGYITLKCDFHSHTVFSDGTVWPTVRVEEAWREGYDGLAITDHIEYQPHKADIPTNHNRSHQIAAPLGDARGVIVVKGSEVTRDMPPGHLNAIFLSDSNPLATKNWRDAIRAAHGQGAFIFWNHPGWERQLTDGKIRWYAEHTSLLEEGMLHGIEVANSRDYYPEAHAWAIERNLAILGNSDIHPPVGMDFSPTDGDRRPMTLVFAKERSSESLKQALFARRTAVIAGGMLLGDEQFVRPIVEGALRLVVAKAALQGRQRAALQLSNLSDLDFELERQAEPSGLTVPRTITVPANRTVLVEIQGKPDAAAGSRIVTLAYKVVNVLPRPGSPLDVKFPVEITFESSRK